MLKQYGFRKEEAEKCLNANKHNQVTTVYYLLHKRYEKMGKLPCHFNIVNKSVMSGESKNIDHSADHLDFKQFVPEKQRHLGASEQKLDENPILEDTPSKNKKATQSVDKLTPEKGTPEKGEVFGDSG